MRTYLNSLFDSCQVWLKGQIDKQVYEVSFDKEEIDYIVLMTGCTVFRCGMLLPLPATVICSLRSSEHVINVHTHAHGSISLNRFNYQFNIVSDCPYDYNKVNNAFYFQTNHSPVHF